MSLALLVFPNLGWGELLNILSFLSLDDVYRCIGRLNRSGWLTFMREKVARTGKCVTERIQHLIPRCEMHEKVLLVSYPRSGNSFLRKLLESSTNIITGSDSRPNRTLSASLLQCGFQGEGITDNSVWVVKSHFPERLGFVRLEVNRVILLVRNPFDAILSYFHMALTNTHDKNLSDRAFEELSDLWHQVVANEAAVWNNFHFYWLECCKVVGLPMIIIRYEDLMAEKEKTMKDIIGFLKNGPVPHRAAKSIENYVSFSNPTGKNFPTLKFEASSDDSIKICSTDKMSVLSGLEKGPGYKPNSTVLGKALHYMNHDDVNHVVTKASYSMKKFGYEYYDPNPNICSESINTAESASPTCQDCERIHDALRPYQNNVASYRVNHNFDIRLPDDRFGRNFTEVRRSLTCGDSQPLERKV